MTTAIASAMAAYWTCSQNRAGMPPVPLQLDELVSQSQVSVNLFTRTWS